MNRRLAAIAVAALALSGCGGEPVSGTIVYKSKSDAWTQFVSTQRCISYNAKGLCAAYTTDIHPVYHPARCWVVVRSDADGSRKRAYVPCETWESLASGSEFSNA